MKKIRRLNEWFDIDVHDVEEEQEKQEAKESTKEEVLKMVDDYHKKDKSIGMALADRIDKEVILSKAQEILLGNIGKLANFLKELINTDKSGEIQKVINSMTTAPAEPAKEEEKPASTPTPAPAIDKVVIYKYIKEHPDILKWINDSTKNLQPEKVAVYYNRQDPDKKKMLRWENIEEDVVNYFNGDKEKACSSTGWYVMEYRIADSDGNPTEAIFEDPKKS